MQQSEIQYFDCDQFKANSRVVLQHREYHKMNNREHSKTHKKCHGDPKKDVPCFCHPLIIAFVTHCRGEKNIVQLFLKEMEINLLFMLALLDSVRFQKYLRRLEISMCKASANVVHGISKLITVTNITELILDYCCIPEMNCESILVGTNSLKKLSLCKCCIDDCGVRHIARQLHHCKPPSEHLQTLNLSSNILTNLGAKFLAESLRTNRHLTSLTLSDNLIKDEGCCEIADCMKCFCLTKDELDSKIERNNEYLIKFQNIFEDYVRVKLKNCENSHSETSTLNSESECSKEETGEDQSNELQNAKTTCLSSETLLIDQIIEKHVNSEHYPFRFSEIFYKNVNIFCKGNNTLTNLNLAFNRIGPRGIRHLIYALQYQKEHNRMSTQSDLNIFLEGNPDVLNHSEYHILAGMIGSTHKN